MQRVSVLVSGFLTRCSCQSSGDSQCASVRSCPHMTVWSHLNTIQWHWGVEIKRLVQWCHILLVTSYILVTSPSTTDFDFMEVSAIKIIATRYFYRCRIFSWQPETAWGLAKALMLWQPCWSPRRSSRETPLFHWAKKVCRAKWTNCGWQSPGTMHFCNNKVRLTAKMESTRKTVTKRWWRSRQADRVRTLNISGLWVVVIVVTSY